MSYCNNLQSITSESVLVNNINKTKLSGSALALRKRLARRRTRTL